MVCNQQENCAQTKMVSLEATKNKLDPQRLLYKVIRQPRGTHTSHTMETVYNLANAVNRIKINGGPGGMSDQGDYQFAQENFSMDNTNTLNRVLYSLDLNKKISDLQSAVLSHFVPQFVDDLSKIINSTTLEVDHSLLSQQSVYYPVSQPELTRGLENAWPHGSQLSQPFSPNTGIPLSSQSSPCTSISPSTERSLQLVSWALYVSPIVLR